MRRETRARIEALLVAAVTLGVSLLPRRVVLSLGRGLGRLWAGLDRRHLEIGRENLRRAFPDWPEARIDRAVRGVYAHFGAILLDILWLSRQPRATVLEIVDWEGGEHARAATASGAGVLYVTAHLGNWEVLGVAHGWGVAPVGVIARPLDNPALDERLCAFRRRSGNTVISKWRALQQTLRAVRTGGGVAVLIDQNVQAKDGIFVEFFGRPAATTTVAAAVAIKTGCALVVARSELLRDGRYRLHYDPPLQWEATGDRVEDVSRLTQALTARIEEWVRETPEQWLWIHRRWKTQPSRRDVPAGADGQEARDAAGERMPELGGR